MWAIVKPTTVPGVQEPKANLDGDAESKLAVILEVCGYKFKALLLVLHSLLLQSFLDHYLTGSKCGYFALAWTNVDITATTVVLAVI